MADVAEATGVILDPVYRFVALLNTWEVIFTAQTLQRLVCYLVRRALMRSDPFVQWKGCSRTFQGF